MQNFLTGFRTGFRNRLITNTFFLLQLRNPIVRSVVDKFSALTFWILMHFQLDLYPKDLDPLVKMWWIRNSGFYTLSHFFYCFFFKQIICFRMLDELEGPDGRANREFRVKFPDEIVTENLGGQLWFGAECLAAGMYLLRLWVAISALTFEWKMVPHFFHC